MHLRWGRQQFDPIGAILLSVSVTCLMLGLSFGQEVGWGSRTIVGLFVTALVLLAAFIRHKRRVSQPIVDFSLFRNRLFTAAIVSSFLCFLSLFAVVFLMPYYLEELLALPAHQAGLLMTAVPLTIAVVAPLSGWLSDRLGSRLLSSVGMAIVCLGLWFLSRLTSQVSLFDIIWPLVVTGFGQALFQPPNNNAILSSVPPQHLGIASGFFSTVRVLGQSSSVALSGAIFTSLGGAQAGAALSQKGGLPAHQLEAVFIHAFHITLITCMIIASIGVFTSLMPRPPGHQLPLTAARRGRNFMGTGKKILIAVDGSSYSLQAIKYVATLCPGCPVEVGLFHVFPMAAEELLWQISVDENFKLKIKEQFERFNDECQRAGQKFLDEAKEILVNAGYVPDFVMTMLRQWQTGIAGISSPRPGRAMTPWSLAEGGWAGSKA